jgi:hypothetical protein
MRRKAFNLKTLIDQRTHDDRNNSGNARKQEGGRLKEAATSPPRHRSKG